MSASDAEKPMTPPQVTERDREQARTFLNTARYGWAQDVEPLASALAQARQEGELAARTCNHCGGVMEPGESCDLAGEEEKANGNERR